MKFSYYPGCSLQGTSAEYDRSIHMVAERLGWHIEDLPDWNCCGATSAHIIDHNLAISLAARNLMIADAIGYDLLVPCAACFNRLKAAEKELIHDARKWIGRPYKRTINILHLHDVLSDKESIQRIKKLLRNPLKDLKLAPYYGCLSVRPPNITDDQNCENPNGLDRIIQACRGQVVRWSYKTYCCGGNLMLTRPEIAKRLTKEIFDAAIEAGADAIVTDCPMCQTNLDTRQTEISQEYSINYQLPIFFITELAALAMGETEVSSVLNKHFVDPRGMTVVREIMELI